MSDQLPVSSGKLIGLAVGLGLLLLLFVIGKVPVSYNLRNLLVRWRVTLLTALTFTLVVALLTAMLAFVNGMYRLTENSGQPGNVIVLTDGATDELFSNLSIVDSGDVETLPGILRDAKGRPLCSREVFVVVTQPIPGLPAERPRRRFVQVRGIDDPEIAAQVHHLELVPGGAWFSQAGVEQGPDKSSTQGNQTAAIQAVLGEGVARELGVSVGDHFELGPRQWVVVGITQSSGSTFGSEVWAKRQLVGQTFGKENIYSSMVLRTGNGEDARRLAAELKSYKKAALQAVPEVEYYASLQETNKQFLVAIYFVAIVMAIGGIFGVMNTMFAAISQRTKDIGVLRILGFARWQILVSFLFESLLIALVGGLLGCAVGYLADGWSATSTVSSGQSSKSVILKVTVDANILAMGLLFTFVMGALGGLLPALSAMRLKPLESLR